MVTGQYVVDSFDAFSPKGNTMGLLDSILGSVLGGGQNQNSGQAALINAVIQMIANRNGGGGGGLGSVLGSALGGGGAGAGGGLGGLGGLIGALTQGGLGNAASSWVGTGQNLPVSAEQLQSALGGGDGGGLLAQLAQQAGMSNGEAANGLSQILPGLIDKLTPDGQVPQQDTLEKMLGSLNIGR
jgi:uncharacterized protein YidB (DUF937 family)